jgi:phage-related protein
VSFNLGTAAGRIIIDGAPAVKGFAVAEAAANAFYGAINAKLDSIERLGDNLTRVGAVGAAGMGVAVRAAANFEQGLSAVKAVSGATADEMDLIRKAALRIGKDTSFSATEAASAMEELVKAGVTTKDILTGAADATVALAAAGEVELPRAAEIAASAMNNFALTGEDLPRVADLIAGAANASAIDVGDFGFSLSQAGATAKLAGLKFDDLAVAIAEMGQAGIKGSDAGTSIKTFLTNLIPTTNEQKRLFEELGITIVNTGADFSELTANGIKPASRSFADVSRAMEEYVEKTGGSKQGTKENAKAAQTLGAEMGILRNSFFDAKGDVEDFATIQEVLKKAMTGLTKEQQLATLNILFGSDALRASAVFAGEGAAGFNEMAAAMGKISAADVAKTRLDNLNGSVEQLKGSFETMLIIIGDVFLPIVKKFVDGLNSIIGVFLNLPEPVQKFIAILLGAGTAMSLFTGLAIKLAFVLVPMLANFLGLAAARSIFSIFTVGFSALRGGAGVMGALGASFGRAGVVFTRFAKIGTFLFGVLSRFPRLLAILRTAATLAFGPWGIALAAIVAAVIIAYNKFQPFHDLVDRIANIFQGIFLTAITAVTEAWNSFTAAFRTGMTEDEGTKIERLALFCRDLVEWLKLLGQAFMENVVPALREAGGQLLSTLMDSWRELSAMFQAEVMPALRQAGAAFAELRPALQELWVQLQPILEVLGKVALVITGVVVVALYLFIKVLITNVLPVLIEIGTVVLTVLIEVLTFLAKVLVSLVSAAVTFATGFFNAIKGAIDGVTQMLHGLITVFKGMISLISALIRGDWNAAWNAAKQIVTGFRDIVVGLFRGLASVLVNIVKGLVTAIIQFFKGLYDTLVGHSIVPDLINAIIRYFATLPGRAASALASLASAVLSRVNDAMNSMYRGFRNGVIDVLDLMQSLPSRIRSALGNVGSILWNAGSQIISGLINGIRSRIGEMQNVLRGITNMIPDFKGPLKTDKELLTENGTAIMQSLLTAFEAQVPNIQAFLSGLTQLIGNSVQPVVENGGSNWIDEALRSRMGSTPETPAEKLSGAISHQQTDAQKLAGAISHSAPIEQAIVHNTQNVYNPVAEKSSVSWVRDATRRAALGVIG